MTLMIDRLVKVLRPWKCATFPDSIALVYHATFSDPPGDLRTGLHNVSPDTLKSHLAFLQEHYRFVEIDEYLAAKSRSGLALLTFDDAYECVFDEALPTLERLEIPCTVFVNGVTLAGKTTWRDRVRFVINQGLVDRWEQSPKGIRRFEGEEFYRYTKNPQNDSQLVDQELDKFLEQQGLLERVPQFCVSNMRRLPDHPLITYGNHTHDHYVVASLTDAALDRQIAHYEEICSDWNTVKVSRALSVPFGGPTSYDERLVRLAAIRGYHCLVLTEPGSRMPVDRIRNIDFIYRLMPEDGPLQDQLARWNQRMQRRSSRDAFAD